MTPLDIYLIVTIGKLSSFLLVFGCLILILTTIFGIGVYASDEMNARFIKLATKSCITSVIFILIGIVTPTTKEAAAIYILPKIVNSIEIQQLPSEVKSLAVEWLKDLKSKD